MELTPNIKRLIIQKMSIDAIPPGGGIQSGIIFLSNPEAIKASFQNATIFIEEAITLVRTGSEPNPYKNASDEEIATELMRLVDERKKKHATR